MRDVEDAVPYRESGGNGLPHQSADWFAMTGWGGSNPLSHFVTATLALQGEPCGTVKTVPYRGRIATGHGLSLLAMTKEDRKPRSGMLRGFFALLSGKKLTGRR